MAKRSVLLIFASIFLIGGCDILVNKDNDSTEVEKENIQTAAWQDEFTRGFLASSQETEEGYYTFESGVGGYTMLFPVNAEMDQTYYQSRNKEYEAIYFGEGREEENYGYILVGHFDDRGVTQLIDANLNLLIGSNKSLKTDDFKKYTIEDNDIYFLEYKYKIDDDNNGSYFVFLSYIKSRINDKTIGLEYSSRCLSESEECKLDLNQERERAKKLFHSVRFNP